MKKFLNSLLILILMVGVMLPTLAYAEGEEDKEEENTEENIAGVGTSEPVNVYLFRGEGCPHCEEALEWFNSDSVKEKYGEYFKLIKYQTWKIEGDEEATADANTNSQLMSAVGEYLEADASGVPFIVIGKNVYSGFDSSDTQTLIDYIMEEYNKPEDERINVIPTVEESSGIKGIADPEPVEVDTTVRDVIIVISFVVLIAGIVFVTVKARKGE